MARRSCGAPKRIRILEDAGRIVCALGHERVLYDAVLAVRQTRPQIIVATFVGGVSDGHGQHQVSGEVAQEAFKAAGDPKVFPEQLKDGLEPWQPLAVYSRAPFARITNQGILTTPPANGCRRASTTTSRTSGLPAHPPST